MCFHKCFDISIRYCKEFAVSEVRMLKERAKKGFKVKKGFLRGTVKFKGDCGGK